MCTSRYVYTYVYTRVWYVGVYARPRVCTCVSLVYLRTRAHILYVYMCTRVGVRVYVLVSVCVRTCICACTYMYLYVCIWVRDVTFFRFYTEPTFLVYFSTTYVSTGRSSYLDLGFHQPPSNPCGPTRLPGGLRVPVYVFGSFGPPRNFFFYTWCTL